MSAGTLLMVLLGLIGVAWANRKNECDDCGSQLLWCDPERMDVPLTRCFTCDGPHPAYVREDWHHLYDFGASE